VGGAEAEGWETRVDVVEPVVVVGYVEFTGVFAGVVVGVADEGAFPLLSLLITITNQLSKKRGTGEHTWSWMTFQETVTPSDACEISNNPS